MSEQTDEERWHRKDWMSDDHWECAKLLADVVGGFHHVSGEITKCGIGITVTEPNIGRWATFDFDYLTRAVILAHDRMIRFEISAASSRYLRLRLFKRQARHGRKHEQHPTIEDAIASVRGVLPP